MSLRRLHIGPISGLVLFLIVFSVLFSGSAAGGVERDPLWRTGGDPRACSAPLWPNLVNVNGPGDGKRVLVIGDSLTRNSDYMLRHSLRKSGWLPTIRCFGGKRLDWANSQVRAQRAWRGIPKTVIIAMGTNDMRWIDRRRTAQRIDELMNRLGPDRDVVWINTFGGNGDRFSKSKQRWFNRTLNLKAAKRPNVVVMQWDRIAESGEVQLSGHIHYTKAGYRLRTQETVKLLNAKFGN